MHNLSSPDLSDAGMEQRLQKAPAPRVTLETLNANIVHTEIVKHLSAAGQILRWAVLTTRSGFAVTGRPSAAVCAENDDPVLGERIAIDNVRSELWPLMGYALRERLTTDSPQHPKEGTQ